jgi:hypothetical protein
MIFYCQKNYSKIFSKKKIKKTHFSRFNIDFNWKRLSIDTDTQTQQYPDFYFSRTRMSKKYR